jgi:hypothetical protein
MSVKKYVSGCLKELCMAVGALVIIAVGMFIVVVF